MKRIFIPILLVLAAPGLLLGSDEGPAPNVSIGLGGTLGRYDMFQQSSGKKNMSWNAGPGYGGGFMFEKMFSSRFGIQSGLWYNEYRLSASETDNSTGNRVKYEITTRGLSMPLHLVTSFNSSSVSLCFLAGLNFFHVFDSKITVDSGNGKSKNDILIYINENQAALSGGIMIKFRITRFTDLFLGGIADFNMLNLFSDNARGGDDTISYLYDVRCVAGIMLRTNIFPIAGK